MLIGFGRDDAAFAGVVTIVTFRPRFAKALDMSSKGMVWP